MSKPIDKVRDERGSCCHCFLLKEIDKDQIYYCGLQGRSTDSEEICLYRDMMTCPLVVMRKS